MTAPCMVALSVKEYAAIFRVTERAVYLAIRETRLPYHIERPLGKSARILVPRELAQRLSRRKRFRTTSVDIPPATGAL